MNYLNLVFHYLSLIIFLVLALQVVYLFVYGLAGRIIPSKKYPENKNTGRFVIYIPSYKEDAVIVDTAIAALAIDYQADKKKVVVIADSLLPETLIKLKSLAIQVVEVSFEKSTKAKALNVALSETSGDYDYALVLDADNVCAKDFLYRMNDVLQSGFKVVQGQRVYVCWRFF